MKTPSELTREQLENIAGQIQSILWMNLRTGVFDPDLSWDSETIEYVSGVLEDAGLKPGKVRPASMADLSRPRAGPASSVRKPETVCRVHLRQTIACQPTDDPSDRVGFIILAGTTGSLRRVARSCRETANWEGTRLIDRESDLGVGHVEFDRALVWHVPDDLPPPDPDDPHPCNFEVTDRNETGGWNVVNVPLEWLEAEETDAQIPGLAQANRDVARRDRHRGGFGRERPRARRTIIDR
jgi:hypothetical protein